MAALAGIYRGSYDPASARIAAEAVLSMTLKLLRLAPPSPEHVRAQASYLNTSARYIAIKESQAELAKRELLLLWTDYFKPAHLEDHPELHEIFWRAAKLCSACKQEVNETKAEQLVTEIRAIHELFWGTKGREVPWHLAG
ncbi:MAG: superoxide dismutase, Ni [Myxococcota bacterium]